MTSKNGLLALATCAALLAGCGDSTSPEEKNGGSASAKPAEYISLEEAGACAPSRYGETVFVIGEWAFYFCSGKKWVVLDDGEDEGRSSAKRSSGSGEQQTVSSGKGSSKGGSSGSGTSQTASSDKQTTSSSQSSVGNPPDVDAGFAMQCYNATPCAFSGAAYDAERGYIKLYEWDFDGDGVIDASGATNSFSHVYPDTSSSARYVAKFCATDDDNNRVCDTTTVNVTNRSPTLRGSIVTTIDGANVVFRATTLTIADPEDNQRDSLWWDFDNDGTFETAKRLTDAVTRAVATTSRTVKVRTKDKWGAVSNAITATCPSGTMGVVAFDFAQGNWGIGTLSADGSWITDTNSAVAEAPHNNSNGTVTWYPLSRGLSIAACPSHDSYAPGVSDCYYGWNDADMFNVDGVPEIRVTLSQWVQSSAFSWGYTNGGFLYVLNGVGLMPGAYSNVDVGNSITINAKIAAGKSAKVYLLESSYNSDNASTGIHKATITGTGSYKEYTLPKTAFQTWSGASNANTANWAEARAIALEYEIGATAEGAPFPGRLQEMLGWKSLSYGAPLRYLGE